MPSICRCRCASDWHPVRRAKRRCGSATGKRWSTWRRPACRRHAREVALDPELRLWRRLDAKALPPIFRETFISPRSEVFLANRYPEWVASAMALAGRLLESQRRLVAEDQLLASPEVPSLVVGDRASVSDLHGKAGAWRRCRMSCSSKDRPPRRRCRHSRAPRRHGRRVRPTARPCSLSWPTTLHSLQALQRSMPHYGRQSWLVFDDGRVAGQGAWPVYAQALSLQ